MIRGDALNALTSLAELPEFASEYVGKVKLAYLDPPFNTQQSFLQYDDALEHSVWLTMMRDRLVQIKELLAEDGSIWVHCDDSEQAHLRVLMDEVFGRQQWIATVIWQKRYSRDNRPAIGPVHDYIIVFAPSGDGWKRYRNRIKRAAAKEYRNPNKDPKGPWRPIPMDAQGHRPNQMYEIVTPAGVTHKPPRGRCWSMIRSRFDELLAEGDDHLPSRQGRVYFGKEGRGRPNIIRYLSEDEGLVPWTWWPHEEVGHTDEAKKESMALTKAGEAFDTPKPERLLKRIVEIGSNPGEVVLDCFLGSGTTSSIAQKMGRRWIGIERSQATLDRFVIPRLTQVVEGTDSGGISETLGWQGGGGFRILDVAPSMFEADEGSVFIAEWASNGKLSEATAAQLGFEFESDPPFAGRKGRSRLAVIDGLVNSDVARMLVEALPDGELLTLCGTAVDGDVRPALRELRRGSTVRKIPASILSDYRFARWEPSHNGGT